MIFLNCKYIRNITLLLFLKKHLIPLLKTSGKWCICRHWAGQEQHILGSAHCAAVALPPWKLSPAPPMFSILITWHHRVLYIPSYSSLCHSHKKYPICWHMLPLYQILENVCRFYVIKHCEELMSQELYCGVFPERWKKYLICLNISTVTPGH